MSAGLFAATVLAGFIYAVTPGPAFLAVFALAAQHGRTAGARFLFGHLAGDLLWGGLALAAIVGVNQLGPALFDALGIGCGLYLIYLGGRAVLSRGRRDVRDGRRPAAGAGRASSSASPIPRPIPCRWPSSRR